MMLHPLLQWGGPAGSIPTAVSGVTAVPLTFTTMQINWTDNSSDENGFRLDYAPISSLVSVLGPTFPADTEIGTIGDLAAETGYRCWSVAFNSAGEVVSTTSSVATTLAAPTEVVDWIHGSTQLASMVTATNTLAIDVRILPGGTI